MLTDNYKSFDDLTLDGGEIGGDADIVWKATNGNDSASYACPRISADRFTPAADIRVYLDSLLGKKFNTFSPSLYCLKIHLYSTFPIFSYE